MATRPHSEAPGLCPPLSPPHERVLSHFRRVQLFSTLWTVAHQAPLSKGFSRQERWSGLPCPPPGDLPHPGTKPMSPWWVDSLPLSHQGSPFLYPKNHLHRTCPWTLLLLHLKPQRSPAASALGQGPHFLAWHSQQVTIRPTFPLLSCCPVHLVHVWPLQGHFPAENP